MSFVGFCGREERRGSEKEINKKNKQYLADRKNKRIDARCVVKLCVKIDKIVF